jgi:predicted MPP superfamily phosphohydrolase
MRALIYYILCWSTIALLVPGGPWSWGLVFVVALLTTAPIVVFMARRGWPRYPTAAFRLLVVRPVLYVQLLLPLVSGAGIIGLGIGALFGSPLVGGRIAALVVLGVLLTLFAFGYVGSKLLVVRDVRVTVPGLPAELSGLTIAQISDLHVGPQTSQAFLRRIARTVAGIGPDLIAITGDLIDDRSEDVPAFVSGLGALRAPLGVYIIPGNHDVYAGWDQVERGLRSHYDATILVNDSSVIEHRGKRLVVVGTGDPAGKRRGFEGLNVAPDIEQALAKVAPGEIVVALAHNPALWPALAAKGVTLTLSGHTHWGQFAIPQLGWSLANPFQKRAMGVHREGDRMLYIHPGTGYWGLPFRLGARPEVTRITLQRGDEPAITMSPARATSGGATRPQPRSAPHQEPSPA